MIRFALIALPLLLLSLALFAFIADQTGLEPNRGLVSMVSQGRLPPTVLLGTWLMEAVGLFALFLLAQGRCAFWWLDGLVTGWVAWLFRGPLVVVMVVASTSQAREPWWQLANGWWVLYTFCGLMLAWIARRTQFSPPAAAEAAAPPPPLDQAVDQASGDAEPSPDPGIPQTTQESHSREEE